MNENILCSRREALLAFGTFSRLLFNSEYRVRWAFIMQELKALDYFNCPASTKFHLCCPGGLMMHSVSDVHVALSLSEIYAPGLSAAKIIITGLLHDVGKCGLLTADGAIYPRYVLNEEPFPSWPKQQKWWTPYIYKDSKPMFTMRDLSVIYASRWGLDDDILQAILIHDGQYDEANKKYNNESPLSVLLTAADLFSSQVLETKDSLIQRRFII